MKKIIPLLLFIIICTNHLNIIDAAIDLSVRYKKENTPNKNLPTEEESETQKENKGKEKSEEQEKYYSRNTNSIISQSHLSDRDKFICYSTKLNKHPYQEDKKQPPKAG